MSDLKPCPFCGESVGIYPEDGETFKWKTLQCAECGARCGEQKVWQLCADSQMRTIAKEWNTRPIEDALNKRIEELHKCLESLVWLLDRSGTIDKMFPGMETPKRIFENAKKAMEVTQ
jgi:hypothetical protein